MLYTASQVTTNGDKLKSDGLIYDIDFLGNEKNIGKKRYIERLKHRNIGRALLLCAS